MNTTPYQLPDGRIVAVDATAAKQASTIDYQLADGRIVLAVIAVSRIRAERAKIRSGEER